MPGTTVSIRLLMVTLSLVYVLVVINGFWNCKTNILTSNRFSLAGKLNKLSFEILKYCFWFHSDVASQVGEIIDEMGIASAKAQELHRPITSAKKMRDSEHTLYLIIDPVDNKWVEHDNNNNYYYLRNVCRARC